MEGAKFIGQTLGGRYRIEELLGQGGMAAVYKAYDPNLQRKVAIKVIKAALADDPKFLSRFETEATAVAQLRHPNIVQVFDFDHDGELYYMVQEFVPGETLQEHLRRLNDAGRVMPLERVVDYTINICDAAAYAHRRGMIHRDIKPANIMLDVHDEAILMDFGIVKITDSVEHTVTGAVIGTARYMSPELIRGEVPDARSDVYSLGITLYEMVSGQPPFDAHSAMTLLMMHLQDPVPDLHAVRPEVPAALSDIINKALAKDREGRYDAMAGMALALKSLQDRMRAGEPVHLQATAVDEPPGAVAAAGVTEIEASTEPTARPFAEQPAVGVRGSAMGWAGPDAPPGSPPASVPIPSPTPASPTPPGAAAGWLRRLWPSSRRAWMLSGAVVLVILAGLGFLVSTGFGGDNAPQMPVADVPAASPTATASPEVSPTLPPAASSTALPASPGGGVYGSASAEATHTPPTPLANASVTITDISIDAQGNYVAGFAVDGYTPAIPGTHIHFYFNTFALDQVGIGGEANRQAWGAPAPFSGYAKTDRPAGATQMCAVVANPDHSVRPGTGNCVTLPDLVTVTSSQDIPCLSAPGDADPPISELPANIPALLQGLTSDEQWWSVVNPRDPGRTCWLPVVGTQVSGNISQLPIVTPPPEEAVPPNPSVQINAISLDADGYYAVEFAVDGYTPAMPGMHIHFYFDTFSIDQVGIGGDANRWAWGAPSPFVGYTSADRPVGATEMCGIVANPDHSVIPGSGNCVRLPGLSVQITNITLDAEKGYVVDFAARGFVPSIPGTHIHFYFDSFTIDEVGIGGDANRWAWNAPSPFAGYTTADRPNGATEMCGIVANPNHSVIPDSGNCVRLPGLPSVEITEITVDTQGEYVVGFEANGFTPAIPGNHIHFYFNSFTIDQVGIGGDANRWAWGAPPPFIGYTEADRPGGATKLCAIVADPNHSVLGGSGNCYPLPDLMAVEITGITVNNQGHYVVDYATWGFTLYDPGTHVHFYFDTQSPDHLDQLGIGHHYSSGNLKPFTGLTAADTPAGATEMCATVVQPDNSVVPASGNCFPLP
ncbi:MAG: serine/threonine protein kinase [Anaerolineae bacterium]